MTKPYLSEASRVQEQSTSEWLADYEGISNKSQYETSQVTNIKLETVNKPHILIPENIKNAGITYIRRIDENLLVSVDRYVTNELDIKIKNNISRLVKLANPNAGESLYKYMEYRTFFINKRPYLALVFNEVHTGEVAERYFNIEFRKSNGKSFPTGVHCEFRVKGNTKRLQEGMFLKFWMDAVKKIPNDRPSQICRYMNSKLSGVVVSCPDSVPHHGITKLKKLKYEGHLYQIT